MPYVSAWIHLIWVTKGRKPLLIKDVRSQVFEHIKENAKKKGIHVDFINGYKDHVHTIISLKSTQALSDVSQLLKGESSHWINKNKICREKFEWQDGFYAISLGYSDLDSVREYIKNQEAHHEKKTFKEECDELFGEERDW